MLGEYDDAKSGAENKLGGCMEKVSAEIKTLGEELCNELIEDLKSTMRQTRKQCVICNN